MLWWCYGGVMMMLYWCYNNVMVMLWWCYNDVMVMLWWCYGDVIMMLWWCYGDVIMMLWWCYGGVIMTLYWCYNDVMVVLWWCYNDVMVMLWWCYSSCGRPVGSRPPPPWDWRETPARSSPETASPWSPPTTATDCRWDNRVSHVTPDPWPYPPLNDLGQKTLHSVLYQCLWSMNVWA